jgi:hypothetical protein
MDDSLESVDEESEGIRLYKEMVALWKKAGMRAHKWMSNSAAVVEKIPVEVRAVPGERPLPMETSMKTLGLSWETYKDTLRVVIQEAKLGSNVYTKLELLKRVAGLFDPCGFLAPCVVRGKIMLQETWQRGCDWDEEMEIDLRTRASE